MRVLVIGGAGLIGSSLVARLHKDGHDVTVAARNCPSPQRLLPVQCKALDMRTATTPIAWLPLLERTDAVVNCAGVLQDNQLDCTEAVHATGPAALFAACEKAGVKRVIHISAIGVDRETPSSFSRSKAAGDAALTATQLDWVLLRPSVVIGRSAYGASALFRGLAALPVSFVVPDTGKLQPVHLDELVATIVFFLDPLAPARVAFEVAGPKRLEFHEVVATFRAWLGYRPARQLRLPPLLARVGYRMGDFAGWLGWRPPIRSNAELEIRRGAAGDPLAWQRLTGIAPRSLQEALASTPATIQDKWFAALYLLKPVVFVVFALFWIATAAVSLGPGWDIGISLLEEGGITGQAAVATLVAGALADLAIGIGIAVRRTTRLALNAALILSLVYTVLGTILVPRLWMDPLGPMLKIWPVLALNLVALAIVDDR